MWNAQLQTTVSGLLAYNPEKERAFLLKVVGKVTPQQGSQCCIVFLNARLRILTGHIQLCEDIPMANKEGMH